MVFNIYGCKLKIDFSFFLIIAFSVLFNAKSLLKLLIFASFHELGHIVSLYLMKSRPSNINISFYGIGLKHNAKLSTLNELIFLLSGIAVNTVFFLLNIDQDTNYRLIAVNALPVLPLDGGRALSLFVPEGIMKMISAVCLVLLALFSLISLNLSLLIIVVYIFVYSYFEEEL